MDGFHATLCFIAALAAPLAASTQEISESEVPGLDYYFPGEADHDPEAPTPESVLGWPFAAWHLHHHELTAYLNALAQWSDRIAVMDYARSHGRRPLFTLAITSPANHARLEEIRLRHLARVAAAAEPGQAEAEAADEEVAPLILWMGYGVHGNEPSASQAGVLLAYHLAAARDPRVAELLDRAVILLDPCLNPDGMERFAAWTNDHRGRLPSPHRADREHREGWPSGRSNYYWFDLNRDWLPAVHPESQGRLRLFHQWMPHVVTDYHEMGNVNRTYFFQPGIPEMVHPLTPASNQSLTAMLEKRTEFASPIFYDVSAWHLPSAYGLLHAELEEAPPAEPAAPGAFSPPPGRVVGPEKAVAYLIPWEPLAAPAALWRLCGEGVRAWVARRPVVTGKADGGATWAHGSLVVPVGPQEKHDPAALRRLMREIASTHGIRVRAVSTALGAGGIDLGSPSLSPVRPPRVLLLVGAGVSSTTAGDVWHQFDQVWDAPLAMAEPAQVNNSLLADFNTLILADASFSNLPAAARSAIESWVSRGGCLVGIGSAVPSLAAQKWIGAELAKADFDGEDESKDNSNKGKEAALPRPGEAPYDKAEERRAARQVKGIVARAWFDATHPLAYGYSKHGPHVALLRGSATFLQPAASSTLNPLLYTDHPLVSGYIAEPNLEALKGTAPVQARVSGSGRVVLFTDNPVFRGHWLGSSKLLANAIFFASLVTAASGDSDGTGEEADEDM